VVALSWSGMGRSGHRPSGGYGGEGFAAEAVAVAEAAGLFESAAKPEIVAHSFGGFVMLALLAGAHGGRFRRGSILDTPIRRPDADAPRPRFLEPSRPHKIYPDLATALGRFRLAPPQGCENLYIADMIARESLIAVEGGWTWAFDPFLWRDFRITDAKPLLAAARCPLVLMWGDRSGLMPRCRQEAPRLPFQTPITM
jgi:pimeloyl-ACP methyl ester carboxylesterase